MFAQQVCLYAIEQNSCCGWRQFPYCDVHLENVLPAVKITYLPGEGSEYNSGLSPCHNRWHRKGYTLGVMPTFLYLSEQW